MPSELLLQHRRIELAIDRVETLLRQIETVPLSALIDARWNYARQVLSHMDYQDAHVFGPLSADPRPAAVETAALFRAERDALAEQFRIHARRYWREETLDADRRGYVASLLPRLAAVRDLMHREEVMLYPLIADIPPPAEPIVVGCRWMAEAWHFRASAPAPR